MLTPSEKSQLPPDEIKSKIKDIGRKIKGRKEWTTKPHNQPTRIMLIGEGGVGKRALRDLLLGSSEETRKKDYEETTGIYVDEEVIVKEIRGHVWKAYTDDNKTGYGAIAGMNSIAFAKIMENTDVFILVLNCSCMSDRDLGLRRMKILHKIPTTRLMVVVTNSQAQYAGMRVKDYLNDVNGNEDVKQFMKRIANRVMLVELGKGQFTDDAGVSTIEREQARKMVMEMVHKVMDDSNTHGMTKMKIAFGVCVGIAVLCAILIPVILTQCPICKPSCPSKGNSSEILNITGYFP